jgi:hypothetical protein
MLGVVGCEEDSDPTSTGLFNFDTDNPGEFIPGDPVPFNWTLANSNQYQIATVDTYYYEWSTNNEYEDEYSVELSNTLRSYTFPANCVDDFGDDTEYFFSIDQVNQTVNGRFVAVSTFSDYMDYYKKGGITKEAHAIRLLKTLGLR